MARQALRMTGAGILLMLLLPSCEDARSVLAPADRARPVFDPDAVRSTHSGCLSHEGGEAAAEDSACGEDIFTFSAARGTLHVDHENAVYNCAAKDFIVRAALVDSEEDPILVLTETAVMGDVQAICECCLKVETSLPGLAPGPYEVHYCWEDDAPREPRCHVERVVMP